MQAPVEGIRMVSGASRLLLVFAVIGWWVTPAGAEPPSIEAVADAASENAQAPPGSRPAQATRGEEPLPRAFTEMIDNIVITTRKRQEAIQDTPLSITALGENSIKQLGVRRIQDISQAIPNLQYDRTVGFTAARVNAR